MPTEVMTKAIDKYSVFHYAYGIDAFRAEKRVAIALYSGTSFAGHIHFYPNGQVPTSRMDGTAFTLNFELERYREIIETLRYEKPIYVVVNWEEDNVITLATVGTSQEPIGEQEGAGVPPA